MSYRAATAIVYDGVVLGDDVYLDEFVIVGEEP